MVDNDRDEEQEMGLEQELKTIWDKYETQRAAERDAAKTRADAERELAELNARRIKAGLETASVYQSYALGLQSQAAWIGTNGVQKTWRSEMESEMMVAIRKAFG
jgi:septation ring formation regulator EzrA